jgi:hypothetical protein
MIAPAEDHSVRRGHYQSVTGRWRVASHPPMLHYHPNALYLLLPLARERASTILHAPLTAARCTLVTRLPRET